MNKFAELLTTLLEYEYLLKKIIRKFKEFNNYCDITEVTSNEEFNTAVISIIENLNKTYFENIKNYETNILKHIRELISIYDSNFYRVDNIGWLYEALEYPGPNPDLNTVEPKMRNFVHHSLEEIQKTISHIHEINTNDSDIIELRYEFKQGIFEKDITDIINLTYEEVITDYKNKCYISAISLCGKIIETILSTLYQKLYFESPEKENLGYNALLNRLRKKGYDFKGIVEQLNLIAVHRNKAIHGAIIVPTSDETRGIISLTKDVIIKTESIDQN